MIIEFEKREFTLSYLIESIRCSATPGLNEKNLEFIIEIDKRLPKQIIGDPVRLFQILNNLIQNAITYNTLNGSVHLFLKLNSLRDSSVRIDFSVVDTGIGIPPEQLDSIFDNHSQIKSSEVEYPIGSNLDLASSKHLLELQDSKFFVESQLNIGSNFSFSLNFELPQAEFLNAEQEKMNSRNSFFGVKLLLVEDYKLNQIVVEEFLNIWNISVDIADNGKIAVEMAEKNNYTIILMDLHMPVLDGYEAANLIRSLPNKNYKSIPIIALTASAINETITKVKNAGMNDFITKPFKPDELYQKIMQYTSNVI